MYDLSLSAVPGTAFQSHPLSFFSSVIPFLKPAVSRDQSTRDSISRSKKEQEANLLRARLSKK
jgi:hypothetical protein